MEKVQQMNKSTRPVELLVGYGLSRTLLEQKIRCDETANGTQGTALIHVSPIDVVFGGLPDRTRTEV